MQEKERIRREKAERERVIHIRKRFEKWCNRTVDILKNCILEIDSVNRFLIGKPPDIIFSEDYAQMLHAEPVINYWLDILCMGETADKQELFIRNRKEVEKLVQRVRSSGKRIMGENRGSA